MTQILFNGDDNVIVVNLESDTVLPGSYVNAEYNKPDDYKIKQLNRLADLVNQAVHDAVNTKKIAPVSLAGIKQDSTTTQLRASDLMVKPPSIVKEVETPTKPTFNIGTEKIATASKLSVSFSVDGSKPIINVTGSITDPNLVSTYEDIVSHFSGSNKFFVTGYTSSKFYLFDKYFIKSNVANTRKTVYRLKSELPQKKSLTVTNLPKTQNFTVDIQPNTVGYKVNIVPIEPTIVQPKAIAKPEPLLKKPGIRTIVGDKFNRPQLLGESYVNNNNIRTKIKFLVPGLNFYAMILSEDSNTGYAEYVFYLDTENPIKYIDLGNGLTIFSYLRLDNLPEETANMVLYNGYVEEPKIISEVFIDRGINTAFEKVKKLKNIKNLNELIKTGLGYYKINTKGYNFKNI
jgi:hypothetical protein